MHESNSFIWFVIGVLVGAAVMYGADHSTVFDFLGVKGVVVS